MWIRRIVRWSSHLHPSTGMSGPHSCTLTPLTRSRLLYSLYNYWICTCRGSRSFWELCHHSLLLTTWLAPQVYRSSWSELPRFIIIKQEPSKIRNIIVRFCVDACLTDVFWTFMESLDRLVVIFAEPKQRAVSLGSECLRPYLITMCLFSTLSKLSLHRSQQLRDSRPFFQCLLTASGWHIWVYFGMGYHLEQKEERVAISHLTYMYIFLNPVY